MKKLVHDFKISASDDCETLGYKVVRALSQRELVNPRHILYAIKELPVNLSVIYEDKDALNWSVTWRHREQFDAILPLVDMQTINRQEKETCWTSLMRAVWLDFDHERDALLARGADPTIKGFGGVDAMKLAEIQKDAESQEKIAAAIAARQLPVLKSSSGPRF